MTEKKTVNLPTELVKRIDENRNGMSRLEFIEFLIENHQGQACKEQRYVTKDELHEFERGIKDLMHNFLDFFVSYNLELGKQPVKGSFGEPDQEVGGLGGTFTVREQGESTRS